MDHFAQAGGRTGARRGRGHDAPQLSWATPSGARRALLGLGVSAISETPDCYHQNEKVITVYDRRVQKAKSRRYAATAVHDDDRARRDKILALMTGFRVALDDAERDDARAYLAPIVEDGLVELRDGELRIPMRGRPFLRNAAVLFDAHFRSREPAGPRYSTAV